MSPGKRDVATAVAIGEEQPSGAVTFSGRMQPLPTHGPAGRGRCYK